MGRLATIILVAGCLYCLVVVQSPAHGVTLASTAPSTGQVHYDADPIATSTSLLGYDQSAQSGKGGTEVAQLLAGGVPETMVLSSGFGDQLATSDESLSRSWIGENFTADYPIVALGVAGSCYVLLHQVNYKDKIEISETNDLPISTPEPGIVAAMGAILAPAYLRLCMRRYRSERSLKRAPR